MMLEGKDATSFDISVDCSLAHGLIDEEKVEEERKSLGEFTFMMEYEGIFFGEHENTSYQAPEIHECRALLTVSYATIDAAS